MAKIEIRECAGGPRYRYHAILVRTMCGPALGRTWKRSGIHEETEFASEQRPEECLGMQAHS